MKRFAYVLTALFVYGASIAQIPNAGFEQWTGGIPTNWISLSAPVPGSIEQSTTARTGSFAVRGNVVTFMGFGFPPYLIAGPDGEGFPVTQRHANVTGYYRFTPVSGDVFYASVGMFRAGQVIGAGAFVGAASQTAYVQFTAPIFYAAGGNPDTCYIQFFIADSSTGQVNVGSFFLIDDLAFSGINAVRDNDQQPLEFSLQQNFPNPFNPSTTIRFTTTESRRVMLKVFDILGKEISTLVNENLSPGSYKADFDAANLPSGVYFYRLTSGNFVATKKMIIAK